MRRRPTWVWWTSGKDAAWALHTLRSDSRWEIGGLLAAVTRDDGRSWLHGVRIELLREQAAAVGLPLRTIEVDPGADPPDYDSVVQTELAGQRSEGVDFIAFGDLFSARRRARRIQLLRGTGLEGVFPLWHRDTREHARQMLGAGLAARVCSLTPTDLPADRVGARFDESFLEYLPAHIDPCGEHDEFHTFVEWAPGWRHRVDVAPVRRLERYGLVMADCRTEPATTGPAGFGNSGLDGDTAFDPFEYFERLRRVRRHVLRNLSIDATVGKAAEVAELAPSSFRRYFRKRVGTTYGVWLADQKMECAARLLRESDASVAEIGSTVGYRFRRSFRRAFRRRYACSPSRYRDLFLAGRLPEMARKGDAPAVLDCARREEVVCGAPDGRSLPATEGPGVGPG